MSIFGKKQKQRQQDKNFVRFGKVYLDCGVIELKRNVYLKMVQVKDNIDARDCDSYNTVLKDLLKQGQQFFYYNNNTYLILRVKAELIDDAVTVFDGLIYDLSEVIDVEEVEIKEWLDIINHMTQFKELGEREIDKGIRQQIQPWERKTKDDYLEIDGMVSKTVLLTNFPSEIFLGLMTEILSVSDKIIGSLYINPINVEHCLEALNLNESEDNTLKRYLEKLKKDGQALYNTSLFLNFSGLLGEVNEIYAEIERIAEKYYVGINILEHQQNQAFSSVLPLCDNCIRYNKALTEESVLGLLSLSWMKKLCSGVSYGISAISGKEVKFNRFMENSSGFYFGKDKDKIMSHIKKEIALIPKDKKIAIFTFDRINSEDKNFVDLNGYRILGSDVEVNREILRALFYLVMGVSGGISESNRRVLELVLSDDYNVKNYEYFVNVFEDRFKNRLNTKELNELMSGGRSIYHQEDRLKIYKSLNTSYKAQILQMMGGIAHCDADVIYVLHCGEMAKLRDNNFIEMMMKRVDKTFTFMGDELYRLKNAILASDFIYINKCDALERINLVNTLKLSKEQNFYVDDSTMAGQSLLITKYTDYFLVDKKEFDEYE